VKQNNKIPPAVQILIDIEQLKKRNKYTIIKIIRKLKQRAKEK